MFHSQNIQQAGEMYSPKTESYSLNQRFEEENRVSAKSAQNKQITDHAEKSTGHANPAQRSNRTLLALVIIVCLISLVVLLLLTLLIFGKVGDGFGRSINEACSSTSTKSLVMASAEIKALEENMTSFHQALMKNIDSAFNKLTSHLTKTNENLAEVNNTLGKVKKLSKDLAEVDNTLKKMENLDSAFNKLTSHLAKTNENLVELKNTPRKFPGCQGPCKNGRISHPADMEGKFRCLCVPGFYGKYCEKAAKSCQELYDAYNFTTSRLVTLHFGLAPTFVFCHMGDFGCGDGAWTTVMKINGSKPTFHYDSDYWSNRTEYNLPGGETGFDSQETKLPTYWNTSFSKICLGIKIGQQLNFITINTTETSSLYSLIADGNYSSTSLGRDTWKALIGSEASLQTNCNKEGFNAACSDDSRSRARIGFVGNNENDCISCDSRIGFGTGGAPDDSNTCGNVAKWYSDNGDKHIKTMGYILVQ
ncbi:uncharacterized protein LOC144631394 [Oculina patagonica]